MSLSELVTLFAEVVGKAIIETYQAGGNPALLILALFGILGLLGSAVTKVGQSLRLLFIILIATPIIMIEEWNYRRKKRLSDKQ